MAVVECRAALIKTLRVTKVGFNFAKALGVVFVFAVNLAPMTVSAATVTTNSFTNTSTYDFSTGPSVFSAGPLVRAIGGQNLTFTSTSSRSVFDRDGWYGLVNNGQWTSARNGYAGLNEEVGTMTFTFDTLVGSVGGFVNYARYLNVPNAILNIYGVGNTLLETFDLTASAPIVTSGDDGGAFRGFQRANADIKSFTLSGGLVVIDDLVIGDASLPAPVPEVSATGSLAAIASLLALMAFLWERRRVSAT